MRHTFAGPQHHVVQIDVVPRGIFRIQGCDVFVDCLLQGEIFAYTRSGFFHGDLI